jgi:chromosome segregation ATPase
VLKNAALKLCKVTPEVSEQFKQIEQDNLQDLEQEMYNLEQQASAIFASSEDIVRQYEQRKAEIALQDAELSEKQTVLDKLNKQILKDKTLWLHGREASKEFPEKLMGLMDLIKLISEEFGRCMSENHCKGEVKLEAPEDDFASYSIEVKVSFRSGTPLQTLSAARHSGGERSVSTMMYLIALQPLTPAPFRLVDEINQAMDPINERRIWEQVVAASSGDKSPQYFLVTPKLLSDLTYSDSIVVHVVFNGVYNARQEAWTGANKFGKRDRLENEDEDDEF